jgi:hypothetical protein
MNIKITKKIILWSQTKKNVWTEVLLQVFQNIVYVYLLAVEILPQEL